MKRHAKFGDKQLLSVKPLLEDSSSHDYLVNHQVLHQLYTCDTPSNNFCCG
jgi:hypothetical protein